MAKSKEFPQYAFVAPRSYTRGRKAGQPTVIFIHTTEGSEGKHSAEDGAAYDARRTDGVSCHFFADQDTVVQCVATTDEAHAARSHGNDVGIQIEVCGKAGQSATQWADTASVGTIEQLARLCVALRRQRPGRFPLVNLTPAQLRAGGKGFAEHYDATRAWPEDHGDHSDPGPNFPWAKLFARIVQLEAPSVALDKQVEDYLDAKFELVNAKTGGGQLSPAGNAVLGHGYPRRANDATRQPAYVNLQGLQADVDEINKKLDELKRMIADLGTSPTDPVE